jgi:hypothetical protein
MYGSGQPYWFAVPTACWIKWPVVLFRPLSLGLLTTKVWKTMVWSQRLTAATTRWIKNSLMLSRASSFYFPTATGVHSWGATAKSRATNSNTGAGQIEGSALLSSRYFALQKVCTAEVQLLYHELRISKQVQVRLKVWCTQELTSPNFLREGAIGCLLWAVLAVCWFAFASPNML